MPGEDLREVRDLARYRITTVQARTPEIQRLQKTLETAGIKVSSVVSEVTGGSATAMIEALISGERRGGVMADLAQTRLRTAGKMAGLSMALTGRFTDHHALMCRLHRDRITIFGDAVKDLDAKIAPLAARYACEAGLLKTLPVFGDVIVAGWLGAIGPAPHQHFATASRLASGAAICPGNYMSAKKSKGGRTGDGGATSSRCSSGRLGRNPGTRPAAGQVPPPGPQVRRPGEQRRAEAGDHRDRPHPAQDRLQRPEDRQAIRRPGRRLLHPPRIPRCPAGLPDPAAPEAQPRLRHHHHPRGGRLTAETTSPPDHPHPQEPPASGRSMLPPRSRITVPATARNGNHPQRQPGHRPGPRHVTGQGLLPRTQPGPNYVSVTIAVHTETRQWTCVDSNPQAAES